MQCCTECFRSPSLRLLIEAEGARVVCDLCRGSERLCVAAERLTPLFAGLISSYSYGDPAHAFGQLGSLGFGSTLAERIADDGVLVFSEMLDPSACNAFLDAVREPEDRAARPARNQWGWSNFATRDLFDYNAEWMAFVLWVSSHRRFVHSFGPQGTLDLPALLGTQSTAFTANICEGTVFHRARKQSPSFQPNGIPSAEQLGAPPSENATAGRANAAGIRFLYVCGDQQTALAEVRPQIDGIVYLATCTSNVELRVFDMTSSRVVRGLDPFHPDFPRQKAEAKLIARLNEEFGRPLSAHVPDRDYAPTQIVAEMISSYGYDGIKFRSSLHEHGVNFVFFAPGNFTCVYAESKRVTRIAYESTAHYSLGEALLQMVHDREGPTISMD